MKKVFIIPIAISSLLILGAYIFFRPYDTLKHCEILDFESTPYCTTNHIYYYGMNIYFKDYLDLPLTDNKSHIYMIQIPIDEIQHIDNLVRGKAKLMAFTLMNKNKIKLAHSIINKAYPHLNTGEEINEDEYYKILRNIAQIPMVTNYIGASKNVEELSDDEIKNLPVKTDTKVRYAAEYNNGIVNYYDDNGKLVLRSIFNDNKLSRYQIFDNNGEFYTYDADNKLVEYSKNLNIYDSENKLIHIISRSKPFYPQINKQSKKNNSAKNDRYILMDELNNKESEFHKSIVQVVDKHYSKGSSEVMVKALTEYLKNLKTNSPEQYKLFENIFAKKPLVINFIKANEDYVFSVNSGSEPDLDTLSSMANTVNTYMGQCAEPNLKSKVKNKVTNNYLYDIKIEKAKDGNFVVREYPPCITCSKNISLWGWKYPKTTISE